MWMAGESNETKPTRVATLHKHIFLIYIYF